MDHGNWKSSAFLVSVVWASSALAQPAEQPAPPAAALEQPEQPEQPPTDAGTALPPPNGAPAAKTIEQQLSKVMGQSGGLTAKQAAERAVTTSRDVRVRESEVVAAKAETNRVLYTSLPRLNLLARYTRLSPIGDQGFGPGNGSLVATTDPPGPLAPGAPLVGIPASALAFPEVLNQYLLQASLRVPLSDYLLSTSSAVDAAESNERAAYFNREAAKLDVGMRTKLLYYDWVRQRLQTVVLDKSVEQAKANLVTSERAFSAGRVSKADVLNAESLLASTELRAERGRTQVALAEERLRLAMHDQPGTSYRIGEDLFATQQANKGENVTSLVAEARRKRLELRALSQAGTSLAAQEQVSDMRGAPKLEAFGNAYYARPNPRYFAAQDEWRATWDVGVQLSWSPNDFGVSDTDSKKLEAERAKIQAQRDTVLDRIQQDVLDAHMSLKEAELGVVTAGRNLTAAEEAYRVQRLFYENGRGTSLQLLDSEARLLQARIDMINMRVAEHMARVALEHAVGRDVPSEALR